MYFMPVKSREQRDAERRHRAKRDARIVAALLRGESFDAIGRREGISRSRGARSWDRARHTEAESGR